MSNHHYKMYRRLWSLAYKTFKCDRDEAHDFAADAICEMVNAETDDFNFGFTVLKNAVISRRRDQKRRNTWQFPVDADGAPRDLDLTASFADADLSLVCAECIEAIRSLPGKTKDVMQLVALGYESDEIAERLDMPKSDVYWRTGMARKILRDRDFYGVARKRGHHKYIGIRKDHHRWSAACRKADQWHYLGYFATAAEAAKAYDAKARELFGTDAKVNFA